MYFSPSTVHVIIEEYIGAEQTAAGERDGGERARAGTLSSARSLTAGLFSEGGEVMKPHIEGSLPIPKPGITRV